MNTRGAGRVGKVEAGHVELRLGRERQPAAPRRDGQARLALLHHQSVAPTCGTPWLTALGRQLSSDSTGSCRFTLLGRTTFDAKADIADPSLETGRG